MTRGRPAADLAKPGAGIEPARWLVVLVDFEEYGAQPEPGEAAQMQLPAISRVEFLEYLDFQFEATDKPAGDAALNHLLNATGAHPRSTQQLAWECWTNTPPRERVTLEIRDAE